ncbi:hypothetical protein [Sphingopyxis panaciterrae]
MIGIIVAVLAAQAPPADRTYEGDWYVSDDTNNNTGERSVHAFHLHLKQGDPNYVTLTMRCSAGKPTFFVEWADLNFPDQTVVTIGSMSSETAEPAERRYVFEKSEDTIERGLRASPDTSSEIVSALGEARLATITAHLSSGPRKVLMDIEGTQRAWNRVSRHCPVRIMERPPI